MFNWMVGGAQGEGIDSTGEILAFVLNRLGYYQKTYRHFSSRIKGGHTHYQIAFDTKKVKAMGDKVDVIVAFDQLSIDHDVDRLADGGFVVADSSFDAQVPEGVNLLSVPLTEIATEEGAKIMKNMVSIGTTAALFGLPRDLVKEAIANRFDKKGDKIVAMNQAVFERGYDAGQQHFDLPAADGKSRLLLSGNEAFAFGALVAGCRFMSAYPITPATDVMQFLVKQFPDFDGVLVQTEDELAALTMALGASYSGARALTATSGPGLSLMQESISLAGMTELPLVVMLCQRGGPATGLPTKMEQSDIFAALHGSHGEIPRVVLTPQNVEDSFYDALRAFQLADQLQCPVFVLSDLITGMMKETVDGFDYSQASIDRGLIFEGAEDNSVDFARYELTASGVSTRSLPGTRGGLYRALGNEHNETAWITEDPEMRTRQMLKRLGKTRVLKQQDESDVRYTGDKNPDLLFVGIGCTSSPVAAAMEQMEIPAAHLGLRRIEPMPDISKYLEQAKQVVVIEHNATGQLRQLVQEQASRKVLGMNKFDGEPFLTGDVLEQSKEVLANGNNS